ncbi:amino acid deaminase [Paracidobacterium acidisoli]|uniref:Amino acid deaminase n=1 Tax=Paracidobacterium acidisoli TaxID=2303751 RepID=A0A372IKS1_9BACT|nr:amino acid deaminase [Paracidobacterium acidisoli]MBT9333093.1 amino acid deaminase [Paracidobacterium acidisoli]
MSERIERLNKGIGFLDEPSELEKIASHDWNLLREDLSLPSAVLYQDKLRHNLDWMQQFITAYGLKLAPHGKTTMAPGLFRMQMDSGAWGITLATAHQTLAAYEHGVRRVLMANQLVGKENMSIIARLLEDAGFEYFCLVDSAELVDQLGAFFSARGQRLHVLVELGVAGGRTGVRDEEQLQAVLTALSCWKDSLALSGIEIYEGVLDDEPAIRAFLERAVAVTRKLAAEGRFQRAPVLLSGAGSAWYDVVAEVFASAGFGDSVEIVLRPGCYLTHDIGVYREAQAKILQRNLVARQMHSGLEPALQVWAYVQSVPEAGRAIVGMGKRDAAFDAGFPVPALHFRPGSAKPQRAPGHWTITKMMDQHAYLQITEEDDLRVGDMIGFDISHPCLTFDKWRVLPVLDAQYQVVDVMQTFF